MPRKSKYSDDPAERNRIKQAAYHARNPDAAAAAQARYYAKNGHKRRIESGCRRGQTYYKGRKEELLKKANTVRKENKQWAVDFLGGKCSRCQQSFPLVCYDFHHMDPKEKDHFPCRLLQGNREKLKAEIIKCELVCANCHRLIHFQEEALDAKL